MKMKYTCACIDKLLTHPYIMGYVIENDQSQNSDPTTMYLNNEWDMYTDSFIGIDKEVSEYTECAKKIYTIKTVSDFWGIFNVMWGQPGKRIDQLEYSKSIHFIRDAGTPVYEDPLHARGGILSMVYSDRIPTGGFIKFNDMWMNMLMILFGNTLVLPNDNVVNGVTFSRRRYKLIIRLWDNVYPHSQNDKATLEAHALSIMNAVASCLPPELVGMFRSPVIYYYKTISETSTVIGDAS